MKYIPPIYTPPIYGTTPVYSSANITGTVIAGASAIRGLSFYNSRTGWITNAGLNNIIYRAESLYQNYLNRIITNVQYKIFRTISQYVDATLLELGINWLGYNSVPDWRTIATVLETVLLRQLQDNEAVTQLYKVFGEVEKIVGLITNVESVILNVANDVIFGFGEALLSGVYDYIEEGIDGVLKEIGLDNQEPVDLKGIIEEKINGQEKTAEQQTEEKLNQPRTNEPSKTPIKNEPPPPFYVPMSGSTGANDQHVLPASQDLGSMPIPVMTRIGTFKVPDLYTQIDATSSNLLDVAYRNFTYAKTSMFGSDEDKFLMLIGIDNDDLSSIGSSKLLQALSKQFGESYGLGNQALYTIGFQKQLPVGSSFSETDWFNDYRSWNSGLNNDIWKKSENIKKAAALLYHDRVKTLVSVFSNSDELEGWIFVAWKYGPEITRVLYADQKGTRPAPENIKTKTKEWKKYFDGGMAWNT